MYRVNSHAYMHTHAKKRIYSKYAKNIQKIQLQEACESAQAKVMV